jgi:hypothetical protein
MINQILFFAAGQALFSLPKSGYRKTFWTTGQANLIKHGKSGELKIKIGC